MHVMCILTGTVFDLLCEKLEQEQVSHLLYSFHLSVTSASVLH